ncbi:MAG: hypothetical protein WDO14_06680 [Bacteroidota bacterium]
MAPETLRLINVILHIAAGSFALVFGTINIVNGKGGKVHNKVGRWFLWCIGIVAVTATIGVLVFEFKAFLAVLTLLVAYQATSGYRVLKTKSNGPATIDMILSIAGFASAVIFIVYLRSITFPWSPVIIYSTLVWLMMQSVYDLARFLFPKRWFASLWLYEHTFKMISSFGAIISAFLGNVVRAGQPYTQIMPSVLALWIAIYFLVALYRKKVKLYSIKG